MWTRCCDEWCDKHNHPDRSTCSDCEQEAEEAMRPAIEVTKKRIRDAFRAAGTKKVRHRYALSNPGER